MFYCFIQGYLIWLKHVENEFATVFRKSKSRFTRLITGTYRLRAKCARIGSRGLLFCTTLYICSYYVWESIDCSHMRLVPKSYELTQNYLTI